MLLNKLKIITDIHACIYAHTSLWETTLQNSLYCYAIYMATLYYTDSNLGKNFCYSISRLTCILPMECSQCALIKENLRMKTSQTVKWPQNFCPLKISMYMVHIITTAVWKATLYSISTHTSVLLMTSTISMRLLWSGCTSGVCFNRSV